MRHDANQHDDTPGGDSFLDIVANIVGILVLLVVVVGVRAARTVTAPEPEESISQSEIVEQAEEAYQEALSDRHDVERLAQQVQITQGEAKRRDQVRLEMATYAAKLRQELDEERSRLDSSEKEAYDTNNELAQARLKLQDLNLRQVSLMSAPEVDSEKIEFDTTPIIRTRVKDEVFLRLEGDRVTHLPIRELKQAVEESLPALRSSLNSAPGDEARVERVVGPVDGFALRCVFQRRTVRTPQGMMVVGGLLRARLEERPGTAYQESIDTALSDESLLIARLGEIDPDKTVITLAIYPDSFDVAPELEEKLRDQGYRVAKTLLREGQPILFSPHGRETALQ